MQCLTPDGRLLGYNKESLTMDNSWCSVLSGYNKESMDNSWCSVLSGYNKESLTMDNSWCSVLPGYNKESLTMETIAGAVF